MALSNGTLKIAAVSGGDTGFDSIYPVGSIYLSVNASLPSTFSGTWERIASGKCLWGANSTGSDVNTTKAAGLPKHTHTINFSWDDTGSTSNDCLDTGTGVTVTTSQPDWRDANGKSVSLAVTNTVQPPALVVCMWKRTA